MRGVTLALKIALLGYESRGLNFDNFNLFFFFSSDLKGVIIISCFFYMMYVKVVLYPLDLLNRSYVP